MTNWLIFTINKFLIQTDDDVNGGEILARPQVRTYLLEIITFKPMKYWKVLLVTSKRT